MYILCSLIPKWQNLLAGFVALGHRKKSHLKDTYQNSSAKKKSKQFQSALSEIKQISLSQIKHG